MTKKTEELLKQQAEDFTLSMRNEFSIFKREIEELVESKVAPIRLEVQDNKSSILAIKNELSILRKDLSAEKMLTEKTRIFYSNSLNYYSQRFRAYSCRLHGFPIPGDLLEGMKSLQHLQKIYDELVVPVFTIAVKEKRLKAVPSFNSTIDVGHYLTRRKATYAEATEGTVQPQDDDMEADPQQPAAENEEITKIPPFILRFVSRTLRDLFMVFKKPVIEEFNKNNGCTLRIGEDLTPDNRANMSFLYNHNLVAKTRMRNSKVQFCLKGEERWRTVLNPYTQNLELMQKAPLDPVPIVKIYPKPVFVG